MGIVEEKNLEPKKKNTINNKMAEFLRTTAHCYQGIQLREKSTQKTSIEYFYIIFIYIFASRILMFSFLDRGLLR